jgi:hypothetical protein
MKKTVITKASIVLFVAVCSLIAVGCAKPYLPVSTPRPTAAPAADKARIYFIKPGGSMQAALTYILKDDKVVGYLENRKVFYLDLPAGEHFFMSVTSNTDGLKATLAGGKTYYVRVFSAPGAKSMLVGGSENLYMEPIVPGSESWGKRIEWVDGNQLITVNPPIAAKWEAKYAAKNAERLANFKSGAAEAKVLTADQGE